MSVATTYKKWAPTYQFDHSLDTLFNCLWSLLKPKSNCSGTAHFGLDPAVPCTRSQHFRSYGVSSPTSFGLLPAYDIKDYIPRVDSDDGQPFVLIVHLRGQEIKHSLGRAIRSVRRRYLAHGANASRGSTHGDEFGHLLTLLKQRQHGLKQGERATHVRVHVRLKPLNCCFREFVERVRDPGVGNYNVEGTSEGRRIEIEIPIRGRCPAYARVICQDPCSFRHGSMAFRQKQARLDMEFLALLSNSQCVDVSVELLDV